MDFDRFEWIFVGVVHCQTVGSVDEWKTILFLDDVWRFVALFSCDGGLVVTVCLQQCLMGQHTPKFALQQRRSSGQHDRLGFDHIRNVETCGKGRELGVLAQN